MNSILYRTGCLVVAIACTLPLGTAQAAGLPGSLYAISDAFIREINPNTGAVLNTFSPPVVPQSGGGSGLAFSGTALYYSSIDATSIYTLNPSTGAILNSFAAPIGTDIDALGYGISTFGPTLYALQHTADRLYLLNPLNGATYSNILLLFDAVGGVDFNSVTSELFLSDASGVIRRLNPNTAAVLGSFATGAFQYGIGIVGGRLFTTNGTLINERNPTTGAILTTFPNPGSGFIGALAGGPVPEPNSILLAAMGAVVLALRRVRCYFRG